MKKPVVSEVLDELVFVNPSETIAKQLTQGAIGYIRVDHSISQHYMTTELRESEQKSLETLRNAEAAIQAKTDILRKRLYAAEAEIAKLRGAGACAFNSNNSSAMAHLGLTSPGGTGGLGAAASTTLLTSSLSSSSVSASSGMVSGVGGLQPLYPYTTTTAPLTTTSLAQTGVGSYGFQTTTSPQTSLTGSYSTLNGTNSAATSNLASLTPAQLQQLNAAAAAAAQQGGYGSYGAYTGQTSYGSSQPMMTSAGGYATTSGGYATTSSMV